MLKGYIMNSFDDTTSEQFCAHFLFTLLTQVETKLPLKVRLNVFQEAEFAESLLYTMIGTVQGNTKTLYSL